MTTKSRKNLWKHTRIPSRSLNRYSIDLLVKDNDNTKVREYTNNPFLHNAITLMHQQNTVHYENAQTVIRKVRWRY